jgi:hypothetical protein
LTAASGILVQPSRTATECEFDLARQQSARATGSDLGYRNNRWSFDYARLNLTPRPEPPHESVEALREWDVTSSNAREARDFKTIWLLAKGHSVGDVAEMTSFGRRWIEQLVVRYNAEGPESLGELRRRNARRLGC